MTTVGEILHAARLHKRLTIEQAEKTTRIRGKFLDAMERNQFDKLPPGTFARGFLKNYASYLGLPVDDTLAFYRRQFSEEKAKVLPDSSSAPKKGLAITPQLITLASIGILLLFFFGYLAYSYFRFAGAPVLNVDSPKNNSVVTSEEIEVAGKTNADAAIRINDQEVTVMENGEFKTKLVLQPGLNTIKITATNRFKREATVTRNLRLEK